MAEVNQFASCNSTCATPKHQKTASQTVGHSILRKSSPKWPSIAPCGCRGRGSAAAALRRSPAPAAAPLAPRPPRWNQPAHGTAPVALLRPWRCPPARRLPPPLPQTGCAPRAATRRPPPARCTPAKKRCGCSGFRCPGFKFIRSLASPSRRRKSHNKHCETDGYGAHSPKDLKQ